MTEKPTKVHKLKNKNAKVKNFAAKPKKLVESDDSYDSGNELSVQEKKSIEQNADKQENEISSEVSSLLATLKREHGIEDQPNKAKPPKNANQKSVDKPQKKDKKAKNKQPVNGNVTANKNAKVKAPTPNTLQANDKKQKKKNKKPNNVDNKQGQSQQPATNVKTEAAENAPAKKKQKNKKKRKAEDQTGDQTNDAAPSPPKKIKTESQGPKVKGKQGNADADGLSNEQREHILKDATPVFVGNLPVNIKHKKLLTLFKPFGKVLSIRVRTNTGKSFLRKAQIKKAPFLIAFIYFEKREAAEASLSLNGQKLNENIIKVDMDGVELMNRIDPKTTVVVGNLKFAVTDEILQDAFECCGKIQYIRVMQTDKGCKGTAYVCFQKPSSVSLALELNQSKILDREIRVEKFAPKKLAGKHDRKELKPKQLGNKVKAEGKADSKPNSKPNVVAQDGLDKKPQDGKKKQKKVKAGKKANKQFVGTKSDEKKKKLKKKKNKLSTEKKLAFKVAPKAPKKPSE